MSRQLLQYPAELPKGFFLRSNRMWFHAVSHVCHNMRQDEISQHMQFFASGAPDSEYDPRIAATTIVTLGGVGMFGIDSTGEPYVVGGYACDENNPGSWKSWMAGTERGWETHWRDITRATRWLMAQLMEGGARRLETNCIASRADAQRWYTDFLGLKLEGELRAYCPNGENLRIYSLTQQDWAERFGAVDELGATNGRQ